MAELPSGAARSADRSRAVDALKLVMAVMVVGIHADPFAGLGRPLHLITAEGLFRLGVPVFLVLNGWYLQGALDQGRGWPMVRRILRLYLLWMLLYLPVYWRQALSLSGWEAVRFAVFGYWHLWYLSGLAMAAAVAVLMARWTVAAQAAVAGAALAGGLALSLLYMLGRFDPPGWMADPLLFNRNPLVVSLPFVLVGGLMRRLGLIGLPRGAVRAVALAGVAGVMGESLLLGSLPRGIAHDLMVSLTVAAPALALWALQTPGAAAGRGLADASAGIYFLHVAFVALMFRHTGLPSPLVWALAIAGSLAVTRMLGRAGLARHLL